MIRTTAMPALVAALLATTGCRVDYHRYDGAPYSRYDGPPYSSSVGYSHAEASAGYSHAEAEIEELDGKLYSGPSALELYLEYEVDIEDTYPAERFDLVIHVTEHGRPVLNEEGQPMRFVVPLEHPHDYDDDEVEFRDRIVLRLLGGRIHDPRHVHIDGEVVVRGTGQILDREHDSVRRHGHGGHVGVHVGVDY